MRKGIIAGVVVILLGGGAVTCLSAFAGRPTEYRTQAARYSSIANEIEASGDIKGEKSTTYYSDVTAPVSSYDLKIGDEVSGNEQVVTFSTDDLEKALEQAILTAESTENTMNGQIAASNQKASLYSQAVADSNTYMTLYATYRAQNNAIDQSQYQENWDINTVGTNIKTSISSKNQEIANKNTELAQKNEELTRLTNEIAMLPADTPYYEDISKYYQYQIDVVEANIASLNTDIASINSEVQALNTDLASLPPATLTPTEYAAEVANGDWMSDIMRNWTQATTVKNTYESQILNSYQKDQLQNSYDLSELNVINVQEDIRKAQDGVKAEYNGIVTQSYINKGSVVSKGSPLFAIESSDELKVDVGISKYDIGSVALGQRATVSIAGREYEGYVNEITRLAQVTDSDKAKVNVAVHINNPDEYVYLGLEADVTIYADEVENTIVVPLEAYYADDEGAYVYVISDDVVKKQYVQVGVESSDYIQIIEGLSDGQIVITDAITDDAVGQKAVAK